MMCQTESLETDATRYEKTAKYTPLGAASQTAYHHSKTRENPGIPRNSGIYLCAVDTKKIFLPNWSLYSNSQHRFLSCDKPNLITCAPNMIKFHIVLYRTIFSLKILLLQIFNLIYIRNIGKQTIIQFQLGVSPLEIP